MISLRVKGSSSRQTDLSRFTLGSSETNKKIRTVDETTAGILNNKKLSSSINTRGGESQDHRITSVEIEESKIKQNFNIPEEGRKVKSQNEFKNPYGQNPFAVNLEECTDNDELFRQVEKYARTLTSKKPTTIARDKRYLRLLSNKEQHFPMDFFNLSVAQWNYHMAWYRENVYDEGTGANYYGLKQRREAFYLLLDACGIPKLYFPYELPKHPKTKPIEFPNPEEAYRITKCKFYKDDDLTWYWQFAHLYNFLVGPRAPSEMAIMKMKDINWDNNYIKFAQPKRHGEIRRVKLPEVFIKGKTRKSLKNYVDYHRPKIANQYSGDFLFISPWSGKPFWKDKKPSAPKNLGKYLAQTGSMVYPGFHAYMGRHFCATGTLILKWIKKHPDPIESTRNFMGHDRRKNTERYTARAEEYYEDYKFDWFKRILTGEYHRGKYARKMLYKPNIGQKTFVSHGNSPRSQSSPDQIRTGVAGSKGQNVNHYTTGLLQDLSSEYRNLI